MCGRFWTLPRTCTDYSLPVSRRTPKNFGHYLRGRRGENYPNLETARAHAAKIASELAKETSYEGFALSVTDEQGNEVAYMPIGEAAN